MLLDGNRIRLDRGPKIHHTRPAADPLFVSAALTHGDRVLGVVLSGGDSDGAVGLRAIKHHGGTTLSRPTSWPIRMCRVGERRGWDTALTGTVWINFMADPTSRSRTLPSRHVLAKVMTSCAPHARPVTRNTTFPTTRYRTGGGCAATNALRSGCRRRPMRQRRLEKRFSDA